MKLTGLGLLLFAAFPVSRLVGILEWGAGGIWVLLLSSYAVCIFVWGIFAIRTETRRSLTPKRALLIPLLMIVMTVTTDLLTRGRLLEWWGIQPYGPLPVIHTLTYSFGHQLIWIAASAFIVIGSAIRAKHWWWLLVGICLAGIPAWIAQLPRYADTFAIVAIVGIVPAIIGYRATESPDESIEG